MLVEKELNRRDQNIDQVLYQYHSGYYINLGQYILANLRTFLDILDKGVVPNFRLRFYMVWEGLSTICSLPKMPRYINKTILVEISRKFFSSFFTSFLWCAIHFVTYKIIISKIYLFEKDIGAPYIPYRLAYEISRI